MDTIYDSGEGAHSSILISGITFHDVDIIYPVFLVLPSTSHLNICLFDCGAPVKSQD